MKYKRVYGMQTIASKKYQTNIEAFYSGGIKPKTITSKASLNRKRNMFTIICGSYGIYLPFIYKNTKVNVFAHNGCMDTARLKIPIDEICKRRIKIRSIFK